MDLDIGELITKSRKDLKLTQDQFGKRYGVSGPAIFKFEKGYVKPSLDLWMKIARDLKISEQETVLLWVQGKLPKKYQEFVSLVPQMAKEKGKKYKAPKQKKLPAAETMRKTIIEDRGAPKGLKALLKDDDIWVIYKPTSEEMDLLHTVFGQLGDGTKSTYREALRLVRDFVGGEK